MAEVRFRARAEADLDDIRIYSLEHFGLQVTRDYLDDFEEVWDLLALHPRIGTVYRDGRRPIFSRGCGSHRIYYTASRNIVWIIRILHHSVDQDRAMRRAAGKT